MPNEVLSQEEVDALVKGVDSGAVSTVSAMPAQMVRTYDFGSQSLLARGRMPTLERINERFGQQFRKSLFNLLRRSAEISVAPVQLKKFGDYVNTLPTPTSLNLVRIDKLRGTGLIVIDPKLVFAVVDNFFGGTGRVIKLDNRDFTATETRIIHVLLKHIFSDLNAAWANIAPLEVEYLSSESNPHFANIVSATEVVVVTTVSVALDSCGGDIHITLPYSMLEPLRALLESGIQTDHVERDERWNQLLREELEDAEIEISAILGQSRLTLAELVNLKPGDIIPCDFNGKATVLAEDIPLFRGGFGVSRGQQAIKYEALVYRPRTGTEESLKKIL